MVWLGREKTSQLRDSAGLPERVTGLHPQQGWEKASVGSQRRAGWNAIRYKADISRGQHRQRKMSILCNADSKENNDPFGSWLLRLSASILDVK